MTIQMIRHDLIQPSPLNPRRAIDGAALAELTAAIEQLEGRPGQKARLDAITRRYRALERERIFGAGGAHGG